MNYGKVFFSKINGNRLFYIIFGGNLLEINPYPVVTPISKHKMIGYTGYFFLVMAAGSIITSIGSYKFESYLVIK